MLRIRFSVACCAAFALFCAQPLDAALATWPQQQHRPTIISQPSRAPPYSSRAPPPVAVEYQRDDVSLSLRRWVYQALLPLDKGDFRWEFLVPFNNKTLTTLDKFIVCSTFIGLSFTLQTVLDPGASVGVHLSYIAQFFSYACGDPIFFRSLAVLTSILEIGGNLFETKEAGLLANGVDFDLQTALASVNTEDVFPIFYDQLFVFINGYYIIRWLLSQEALASALEWTEDQEALYTNCFAELGFRRAQFSRLLQLATFVRVDDENADVLTVQGEPIFDLFVPLNGTLDVRVGGTVTTTLPPYTLVGEASLLENLQSEGGEVHPTARASVVAAPGSFYVRWPQSAFYMLQQEEDSDFAYSIQLMIARTLSEKLNKARLSQSESERRLQGRLQSMNGQFSPLALRAKRLEAQRVEQQAQAAGGADAAAAAGTAAKSKASAVAPAPVRGGATAEVAALLRQNEQKDKQLLALSDSLAEVRTELTELRTRVALLATGAAVLLCTCVLTASYPGWYAESFQELAAASLLTSLAD